MLRPARGRTSGRAAALGGHLRRGSRPHRARRRAPATRASPRRTVLPGDAGRPCRGPATARTPIPAERSRRRARAPSGRRARAAICTVPSWRCAVPHGPLPLSVRSGSSFQRRREASQPASSNALAAELGLMADRQRVQAAQQRLPVGQIEARGQPLAPRRRPQPRQVDHVGGLEQVRRAVQRRRRVGQVVGVQQDHVGQLAAARRIASSWPCGHHSIVGNSETTTGSTIVSSPRQVLGAHVDLDSLVHHAGAAGVRRRRSSSPRRRRAWSGPPRPRTGSCARRGSGPRARAGWRSRPSRCGRRSPPG